MTWTPLVSFFVLLVIFSIGNEISLKTRSVISLMIVSSVLFLLGYWTGIIPLDAVESTGLTSVLANFGLAVMVTNLGTMMDLNQLLAEWKTVAICLVALFGLGLICLTVGTWIFGFEYAMVASVPISGGSVATTIIAAACEEHGRNDLGGYAALVSSLQFLVGMPVASFMMKDELTRMQRKGNFAGTDIQKKSWGFIPHIKRYELFKKAPSWWTRPYPILARLTLLAVISQYISL